MKNTIRKFLEFNGKAIYFLSKDGEYWIALKPICEALGVNYNRQFQNLKEHKIFGKMFAEQQMVAADNRIRKMISLPEMYVYGWLFQIKSSSDDLAKYQDECCKILYRHFHGVITNRREVIKEKIELQQKLNTVEQQLHLVPEYQTLLDLQAGVMRTGKDLKALDQKLMSEQLTLFES